ncbi:hypothetical protein ANCDUO_14993 [Ancylostoma duodenale]|uniref:Uncharacterized protein n=1 Tax=Ancylostoma duodenale TaxID=51022 RepID=A0A0C2CEV8_9BILA|nr:hypothetical protein ANCDUO_14993 [Ancylostoma duodenale]
MSDRLPDIQTKLDQSDEIDKTAASFMKTSLNDYSMYEVDEKHNTTCPPDLMGFDVNLLRNLTAQDAYLREQLSSCVKSALAAQDPCTLADDEREELLRQKRKEQSLHSSYDQPPISNYRNPYAMSSNRRLVDMNASMPIEVINQRSDVDRAFARTVGNQSVARIARSIENRHATLSSLHWFNTSGRRY